MNEIQFSSIGRRRFLQNAALGSAAALFGVHSLRAADADAGTVTLPFANGERRLIQFPQKRPFAVFNEGPLTP